MHIAGTVVTFGLIFLSLCALDVSLLRTMRTSLLLALALSFSSTVFAVKALEESGEMGALRGRVAVGILIMQDLIAVIFLTASTGKVPSWISLGLLVGAARASSDDGMVDGAIGPWRAHHSLRAVSSGGARLERL
jgi:Kef-type K+ transport system membrane component KefB